MKEAQLSLLMDSSTHPIKYYMHVLIGSRPYLVPITKQDCILFNIKENMHVSEFDEMKHT